MPCEIKNQVVKQNLKYHVYLVPSLLFFYLTYFIKLLIIIYL